MGQAVLKFTSDIPAIINRLLAGISVSRNELKRLLRLSKTPEVELLFSAARTARNRFFGNDIFLYGFLYFSTYCKKNCTFCQYRNSNLDLPRYRKNDREILAAANQMKQSGVHLIDLTMGEDPLMFSSGSDDLRRFGDMVIAVMRYTQLPIMISPGVVPDALLARLVSAGVDWYACYQETHNPSLFESLRTNQSFDERLAKKKLAKRMGMLVEEGLLLGVGEDLDDVVDSLYFMKNAGVDQVRAMTFVPQKGVTIDRIGDGEDMPELLTIAVMRLLMPDRLLPASLDVGGLEGLAARLDAGANVVTSIVPPANGLAGVANKSLDIEEARRTLDHINPIIKKCGLKVASQARYREWICSRRAINASSKANNW